MKTKLSLALFCFCYCILCAGMQARAQRISIPVVPPEEIGLSAERLQRIDNKISGYIDRKEAAGALALIARDGKIGYMQTWGDRDRESDAEMTEDTIFRIYSMTKPITSVAVMMLYEEGHFFLNDPVAKYLPELAKLEIQTETRDPETGEASLETRTAKNPIRIRDLLRHTAGFTYGIFGNTSVDKEYRKQGILAEDVDIAETVTKLGKIPLQFEPGTRWHYSVSVDVAGRLVEVVSGQSLEQFFKERIFEPLSMVDTGFRVPPEKRHRFATLYTPKGTVANREAFLARGPATKEIEPLETNELSSYGEETTYFSGGGGLASTARDYLRFCQMMLNGGTLYGQRILSRKTVELMTTSHMQGIKGFGDGGRSFGLGFSIVEDVGASAEPGSKGTYAWGGAAGTKFWIDPQEKLIGVFMVQILPHRTRMGDEFRHLVYQAIDD